MKISGALRMLVKLSLGLLSHNMGLARVHFKARDFLNTHSCLVLTYHRVLPQTLISSAHSEPSLIVSAAVFREQMLFLKKYFRIITMDQLVASLKEKAPFNSPSCVITLDDGWRDSYLHAFPILKELSVPATVFVVAGAAESRKEFWFEALHSAALTLDYSADETRELLKSLFPQIEIPEQMDKRGNLLLYTGKIMDTAKQVSQRRIDRIINELEAIQPTAAQEDSNETACTMADLKEMLSSGLITIGSHTMSHAILTKETESKCREEIVESKKLLEKSLGIEIEHFCYPNGDYDARTQALVEDAGYRSACTCHGAENMAAVSPFEIRRINIPGYGSSARPHRFSKALFAYEIFSWRKRLTALTRLFN